MLYYEIVSEIIITFVMVAMAHVLGHKLVKLVEAPIREDEHFLIAPPRRKANCVKHARKLRGQFARRNTYADCQSETLIVLPSISTDWIAGCTVAGVIMVLLTLNHVDGAAQLFVAPQDHDIFYDYMIALMGFRWPMALSLYWLISSLINVLKTIYIQKRYVENA